MSTERHKPVQIVIGDRFLTEAALLESGDPARWVGRYDPDVLRAPIDLVVDRHNLTSDLPDEPVLPFLRAVANATRQLAMGERTVVEFSEAPIELVLEPWSGGRVAMSIIEFGRTARFRAHRVLTSATTLMDELRGAVLRTAARVPKRNPALRDLLDTLGRELGEHPLHPRAAAPPLGGLEVDTRSHSGVSLNTQLVPDSTGLGSDDVSGDIARFALMATGTVTLTAADGRGLRMVGSPIRLLGSIVDALRDDCCGDDILHVELARDAAGLFTGSFRDGRAALSHPSGKPLRVPSDELVRLVSEHTSAVASSLRTVNPLLTAHPDVRELDESAAGLQEFLPRPLSMTGPITPVVAARPRREASAPSPDGWAFPSSAIRRMRYERSWTLVRTGVLQRTVAHRPDDGLLVCSASAIELIDVASGRTLAEAGIGKDVRLREDDNEIVVFGDDGVTWLNAQTLEDSRREQWAIGGTVRAVAVGRGAAFAALDDGRLLATNGRGIGWSTSTHGPPATGLVCVEDIVVVAREGVLEGRSRDDGRLVWSTNLRLQRVSVRAVAGWIAVVADNPLRRTTTIGVLDPHTGRWVRRTRLDADIRAVGWQPGRGVAVLLDDGAAIRAAALDVAAEVDWTAPTQFRRSDARARARLDRDGIVATFGRTIARICAEGVAWQAEPANGRGDALRLARRNLADGLVVAASGSELLVFETSQGRVLHRVPAFWEQLVTLVADARGHVVVIEAPDDGATRIHGVSAVGVIAALDGGLAAG